MDTYAQERFWDKVLKFDGCWIWQACLNDAGYGIFRWQDRNWRAHRIAWMLLRGPLTDGRELDHLCHNRACVNPEHLREVDHRTNLLAGNGPSARDAKKTHCKYGHPFDERNTAITPLGARRCRRCNSIGQIIRQRKYRAAKKAAKLAAASLPPVSDPECVPSPPQAPPV